MTDLPVQGRSEALECLDDFLMTIHPVATRSRCGYRIVFLGRGLRVCLCLALAPDVDTTLLLESDGQGTVVCWEVV